MNADDPSERAFVLFDLEWMLATTSKRDHTGEPTAITAEPGVADILGHLEQTADMAIVYPLTPEGRGPTLIAKEPPLARFFSAQKRNLLGSDAIAVLSLLDLRVSSSGAARRKVYVSASRHRRAIARRSGWLPCPDPRLVLGSLRGAPIGYYMIRAGVADSPASVDSVLDALTNAGAGVVPINIEHEADSVVVHAYAHAGTIDALPPGFVPVQALPSIGDSDVFEVDIASLHADERSQFFGDLAALEIRHFEPDGTRTIVSAPGDVEVPHPPRAAHGHIMLYAPSPFRGPSGDEVQPLPLGELTTGEIDALRAMNDAHFHKLHDPLWGGEPLPDQENTRIVGRGTKRNRADNKRVARHVLKLLTQSLPKELVEPWPYDNDDRELWNVHAVIGGKNSAEGMVILAAHLDSRAEEVCKTPCAEPGADDDASGMAAVLYAAEILGRFLKTRPRRQIRLVLFNDEEPGIKGSHRYVEKLVKDKQQVAAMIQLDMIGWKHPTEPRTFEMHGPPSNCVPKGSTLFERSAAVIAAIEKTVGDLKLGYKAFSPKTKTGPFTEGKSDHMRFWRGQYAACWVAERGMSFLGDPKKAGECNPDYHTGRDRKVDAPYAVDITRAVVATLWRLAKA